DSVVILDLTINMVDSTVTQINDITLEANATEATYQWLDCGNNFSVLSGETNQNFVAIVNGGYAVEVTENGCVDTSACITISSVGITELLDDEIQIIPNPTSGEFYIKGVGLVRVQILTSEGRVIFEGKPALVKPYDLTKYPDGIYYVRIVAQRVVITKKLVVLNE